MEWTWHLTGTVELEALVASTDFVGLLQHGTGLIILHWNYQSLPHISRGLALGKILTRSSLPANILRRHSSCTSIKSLRKSSILIELELRCWFLFASKLIHTSFFDQNLILSKIYLKQIFHKILLILIVSLQLYFLCIIFLYDK